jgi:hypothetical protein
VFIDAPFIEIQIFFDYKRSMLIICRAGPLMNGVLIGMTLANGYLYPITIAGITTAKFAAVTLHCATHACWHFGVHYIFKSKKSAPIDEDWELVS